MTRKKNILILSISVGFAVILAVIFTSLGFTIWKPKKKSVQQWLYDFENSLAVSYNGTEERKTEKSIFITENGAEVALYSQLLEIKNQNEETVAHFSVYEKYPTLETNEFDICDEYYFINDTMYMQRTAGNEINGTEFTSTWEVFWQVVNENAGSLSYDFSESNFTDLLIAHENEKHILTASVPQEKKYGFFIDAEDVVDMNSITLSVIIDNNFSLLEFRMNYIFKDMQSVEIKLVKAEPTQIEIKDFVRR